MSVATYPRPSAPFLSRERTVAEAHFNRWLVPPAALAIHLCIGMAYGFSVFWLPLSRAVGVSQPIACPSDMTFLARIVATTCDWQISMLGWTYTLFFVLLGCSAALFGGWLEHAGPRKAGLVSAVCWCGGLVISAAGISLHQIWMLWLGSGVLGGIGLGLGYISPVSTLIKWFPDRRGMATGMAIMGFGGGAMIGAPLADLLMRAFATPTSVGVWQTFLVLAAIYFVFMVCGALGYRVPAEGWKPAGWSGISISTRKLVTKHDVSLEAAWRTPQFWLLWAALCLNVSAGIGVIGMASPMLQEVFGGRLIGLDLPFSALSVQQKGQIAAIAAGFTGLLSLCNIGGRLAWASFSDRIGRKATFFTFFAVGFALYALVPWAANLGGPLLFVLILCVVVSMYGGGFATIPAYLADLFGTGMVGAIHGRILTAWAAAGILGPVLINYLREYQIASGIPQSQAYNQTMYILAGLLVLGFICNLLVRPVAERHYMPARKPAAPVTPRAAVIGETPVSRTPAASERLSVLAILAWAAVGLPLAWGVWITIQKALILLH
ncbi:OFA family MFS transporter [Azorhizobium doebereinerae]|uniref:OFA family MFS transporter n=1 Tax=Azorhizobium doebereinerae TaxID=281091 RepID=UPI00048D6515|nr:OFA family MFS transporter [Azorhizobium doebereinerae]